MARLSRQSIRDRTIELAAAILPNRVLSSGAVTDAAFLRRIDACDLVTLDVFDTVLVRPLMRPDDAFEFLGSSHHRRIRLQAEEHARAAAGTEGRSEVTLREIHESAARLDRAWEPESTARFEVEIEHRLCRPHVPAIELSQYLEDAGVGVAFVTDTYLSEPTVRSLLGDLADGRPIVASSEFGTTKRSGDLFDIAARELGAGAGKRWLHIGDTLTPDVLRPLSKSIVGGYVPRPIDQLRRRCDPRLLVSSPERQCVSVAVGAYANEFAASQASFPVVDPPDLGSFALVLSGDEGAASRASPSEIRAAERVNDVIVEFEMAAPFDRYRNDLRRHASSAM